MQEEVEPPSSGSQRPIVARIIICAVNGTVLALMVLGFVMFAGQSVRPLVDWFSNPIASMDAYLFGSAFVLAAGLNVVLFLRRRAPTWRRAFCRQLIVDAVLFGLFVWLATSTVPLQVSMLIWRGEMRAYAESLRARPDAVQSILFDEDYFARFGRLISKHPGGTEFVEEEKSIGPFRIKGHSFYHGRPVLHVGGCHGLVFDPRNGEKPRLTGFDRREMFCHINRLDDIDEQWLGCYQELWM